MLVKPFFSVEFFHIVNILHIEKVGSLSSSVEIIYVNQNGYPQFFFLWTTPVDKSVDNVENLCLSTAILGFLLFVTLFYTCITVCIHGKNSLVFRIMSPLEPEVFSLLFSRKS